MSDHEMRLTLRLHVGGLDVPAYCTDHSGIHVCCDPSAERPPRSARRDDRLGVSGSIHRRCDASSANADYVEVFNPHGVPVSTRLTFLKPDGTGTTRDQLIGATSRSEVYLQAETGIAGSGDVSVAVQSLDATRPIYVEHSHYFGSG